MDAITRERDMRPCTNCDARVYWTETYCASCKQLPERRCLDCGQTRRNGRLDYVDAPVASWTPMATPPVFAPVAGSGFRSRSSRCATTSGRAALPGPCASCGSTNIAPLEFGLDQMPEAERYCKAWPKPADTMTVSRRWAAAAKDDPGITLRDCGYCELPLDPAKAIVGVGYHRWNASGVREYEAYVHEACKGAYYAARQGRAA
jgi:hypothetical protein